jgi:hypothetical protein
MNYRDMFTTKKGCFNCNNFKSCKHIKILKDKGYDFRDVMDDNEFNIAYRYGCACSGYQVLIQKEKVEFN